jgi:hypothetical protein
MDVQGARSAGVTPISMARRSRLFHVALSLLFVACFGSQSLRIEGADEGPDAGVDATSQVPPNDADASGRGDATEDALADGDALGPTLDAANDVTDDGNNEAGTGPRLLGLSTSAGVLAPAFDPDVLSYTLTLPFWMEQFAVSPVVAAPFAALVAGVPVASAQPSKPLLATVGSTLQISVGGDAGAPRIYSIAIAKSAGAPLMFKATNPGVNDGLGTSLAISSDVAVVGAWAESSADAAIPSNDAAPSSGAVYVYTRAANNTWSPNAYLKASNIGAQDRFGEAVAIDGDTIVVGARFEDSNATGINGAQNNDLSPNSGAVYVFRRNGALWQQEAYLKASNAQSADEFGSAVAIRGDRIAVGALRKGNSLGAAYVFRRNGTVWQEEAAFPGIDAGAGFGISVALDDQRLVVGARYGNAAKPAAGAAYVYLRAGTSWSLESTLTAPNARSVSVGTLTFGARVALSADLIAVSDPFEDGGAKGINGDMMDTSLQNAGAVYLYRRGVGGWAFEAYIKAGTVTAEQRFGSEVAIEGDRLVVGAPQDSNGGEGQAGGAYVFRRFGQVWFQEAVLRSPGPTRAFDFFGQGVAVAGGRIFAGATGEDSSSTGVGGTMDEGLSGSGAAFLFP